MSTQTTIDENGVITLGDDLWDEDTEITDESGKFKLTPLTISVSFNGLNASQQIYIHKCENIDIHKTASESGIGTDVTNAEAMADTSSDTIYFSQD